MITLFSKVILIHAHRNSYLANGHFFSWFQINVYSIIITAAFFSVKNIEGKTTREHTTVYNLMHLKVIVAVTEQALFYMQLRFRGVGTYIVVAVTKDTRRDHELNEMYRRVDQAHCCYTQPLDARKDTRLSPGQPLVT